MQKTRKILGIVGFCGLGIFILACIFNLNLLADIGLFLLFGSTLIVLIYSAIKGYSPVEP